MAAQVDPAESLRAAGDRWPGLGTPLRPVPERSDRAPVIRHPVAERDSDRRSWCAPPDGASPPDSSARALRAWRAPPWRRRRAAGLQRSRVVHLAPDRRQQATAKLAVGRGQGLLRRTLLHRNLPALDRHAQQLAVARVGADDSMGAQQVLAAPTTLGAPHTAWLRSAALHWVRAPCVTTRDEPAVSVTTSDT